MRHLLLIGALASIAVGASGAEDTSTCIFDPSFRTLKVEVPTDFMAPPVISLSGDRGITISFDRMGDEHSYLRYSLVHCDKDWQPTTLAESEWLDAFNEAEIDDYGYSAGVFRPYVNYKITLPTERISPTLSGNYLLRVWDESEPEQTLLQARFSISEDLVEVQGQASAITDLGTNDNVQQLSLQVHTGGYQIATPFTDVYLTIEQNGIDVTPSGPIRPMRVEPGKLIYEHIQSMIFPAGNEFRRFETVRTDYDGMHVQSTLYEGDGYTAYLDEDSERWSHPYSYDSTQAGRYKIDEYSSTDPDLGADYLQTVFTLDYPESTDADVVIDGEFVRPLPLAERTMRYDSEHHLYTLTLPLKQGSYNYRYGLLRHGADEQSIQYSPVEGDKYQTRNEYVVKVWHRPPGARYDRLIGYTVIRP